MQGTVHSDTKLTPKQAAELLGVTEDTLYRWRADKMGPPFYKPAGRVFYFKLELKRWEVGDGA